MKKDGVYAIIAAILFGLSAFSLKWMFDTNADIRSLTDKIQQIQTDRETMAKHWKLHSWAKDEINGLRNLHEKGIASWPDL